MCFRIVLAFSSIFLMGCLSIGCTKGQSPRKRKKKPASSTNGDSLVSTVTGATAETIVETPDVKSKETDGTPLAKSAASAPVAITDVAVLNNQLDNTQSNNTGVEAVPKEETRSVTVPVGSVQFAPSQYGEKVVKVKKDLKARPMKQEQNDSLSSLKPSKKEAKRSAEILKTRKVSRKHPDYKTIQSNAMSDFDKTLSQAPATSTYEIPKLDGRKV